MYPYYAKPDKNGKVNLKSDDIEAIQKLYGILHILYIIYIYIYIYIIYINIY